MAMESDPALELVGIPSRKKRIDLKAHLPTDAPEDAIRDQIRFWLNHLSWVKFWLNQERVVHRPDGGTAFVPGLCPGSADLIGIVKAGSRGIFVGFEVKRPGFDAKSRSLGRKRQAQEDWGVEVIRLGGGFAFVHSLSEAIAHVASISGVPHDRIVLELEAKTKRKVPQ